MNSKELFEHFMKLGEWVDTDNTVDRFVIGDPDKKISKVAVAWMSDIATIERALEMSSDLLITHEPTYYNHFNDQEEFEKWDLSYSKKKIGLIKEKLLRDSDLVVMRNHDVWDLFPEYGIPFAWAKFLGITSKPVRMGNNNYQHRYDIEELTLLELGRRIAVATEVFGQQGVRVFGDPDKKVSKIGIGTGCGCQITDYIDMGCDVSIVCDDGQLYWMDISFAKDLGHPVIQVNHAVSEEPGMISMSQYINKTFEDIEAFYIPHKLQATYLSSGSM